MSFFGISFGFGSSSKTAASSSSRSSPNKKTSSQDKRTVVAASSSLPKAPTPAQSTAMKPASVKSTPAQDRVAIALPGTWGKEVFIPASSVPPGYMPPGTIAVTNHEGQEGFVKEGDVIEMPRALKDACNKIVKASEVGRTQEDIDNDVDALLQIFLDGQLIIPYKGSEDAVEIALDKLLRSKEVDLDTIIFNHKRQSTLITKAGWKQLFDFISDNRDIIYGFRPNNVQILLTCESEADYIVFENNIKRENLLVVV